MLTSDVENFPGFDEPIKGPVLMERMRRQAERFGTRFVDESITEVDFTSIPLKIRITAVVTISIALRIACFLPNPL